MTMDTPRIKCQSNQRVTRQLQIAEDSRNRAGRRDRRLTTQPGVLPGNPIRAWTGRVGSSQMKAPATAKLIKDDSRTESNASGFSWTGDSATTGPERRKSHVKERPAPCETQQELNTRF
jgi:hypothetical protein